MIDVRSYLRTERQCVADGQWSVSGHWLMCG